MRCIWTTEDLESLKKFQKELLSSAIEHTVEIVSDNNWSSEHYGTQRFMLWIHDEAKIDLAKAKLEKYLQPASQPSQEIPLPQVPSLDSLEKTIFNHFMAHKVTPKMKEAPQRFVVSKRKVSFVVSNCIILLCSLLYLFDTRGQKSAEVSHQAQSHTVALYSPVEKNFLFDFPEKIELVDLLLSLYSSKMIAQPDTLPESGKILYKKALEVPVWKGFYPYLLSRCNEKIEKPEQAPLCEKIQEGEVWRLVTPIFLHGDLLHLFFNMVWLLIVGTQMELRVSPSRYLLFIAITATISNIAQYLMSGFAFMGFSGVVCAIVCFIYQRQQRAPWEGYMLSSASFRFVLFFIGVIALLSGVSFAFEALNLGHFSIGIASTAHLVGAAVGAFLGRLQFFALQE